MYTARQKATFLVLFVISIISALFFLLPAITSAQAIDNGEIEGFAWSSTIGWISMNCSNTSTCGTVDYGVRITDDKYLVGHGWSSNIGWVQFGNLSAFPTATGNTTPNPNGYVQTLNAYIEGTGTDTYELSGFARACAGTLPGDCSSMTSRTDGWDGWVSLRGDTHRIVFTDFVTTATPLRDHFAWGSTVSGWISFFNTFDPVRIGLSPEINAFIALPPVVELGNPVTLEWNIQGFDSCTAAAAVNDLGNAVPGWSGSVPSANGSSSQAVTPPEGITTYTLTCSDPRGPVTDTVDVEARPDIDIDAFSMRSLPAPEPDGTYNGITFLADVLGVPAGRTAPFSLTFAGQTITGTVNGTAGSATFSRPLQFDGVPIGPHTAVLEVDLPEPGSIPEDLVSTPAVNEDVEGNSSTLSSATVSPAPPTLSISATDEFVRYGESTTIEWSADSPYPTMSCRVVGPGMNVPAPTNTPGSETTQNLTSTGTFTITCTESLTNTTFSEEQVVEVIPKFEEI